MTKLLHTTSNDLTVSTQAYLRTSTWQLGDARVRTVVHVDSSYPSQSRLRAELWDGSRWNEVTQILGTDPGLDVKSGYSRDADAKAKTLESIERRLLDEVKAVVA